MHETKPKDWFHFNTIDGEDRCDSGGREEEAKWRMAREVEQILCSEKLVRSSIVK